MAIQRGQQVIRYPTGEIQLAVGDRLLAVGTGETLQSFEQIMLAPQEGRQ